MGFLMKVVPKTEHLLILPRLVLGRMFLGSEFFSPSVESPYNSIDSGGICLEDCELGDQGHPLWSKVFPTPGGTSHKVLGTPR